MELELIYHLKQTVLAFQSFFIHIHNILHGLKTGKQIRVHKALIDKITYNLKFEMKCKIKLKILLGECDQESTAGIQSNDFSPQVVCVAGC